jgi:hypothetical protein
MKILKTYEEKIPSYALPCLINSDFSGLSDEDEDIINKYINYFYHEAKQVNGYVVVETKNDEEYFTWNPAFGLACNVTDCLILICK